MKARYGLFVCLECRDNPSDDCGDACSLSWAAELPPLWADDDELPTCSCCGRVAQLVTPFVPLEVALAG
jgi:hypothetical protein